MLSTECIETSRLLFAEIFWKAPRQAGAEVLPSYRYCTCTNTVFISQSICVDALAATAPNATTHRTLQY